MLAVLHREEVWLPRDDSARKGAVGSRSGPEHLLETSVPGIFAAGDARSGSTKRCATAVGEEAMAVQFVHERVGAATPVTGGA